MCVSILRDQRGLGNRDVGMGNQLAINQLIAHHSVVFKPDSLLVWVSAGPWQLGKFVAYDLKKIFSLDDQSDIKKTGKLSRHHRTIPADTFLNSMAYRRFQKYQDMTGQLARFSKKRQQLPDGFEQEY